MPHSINFKAEESLINTRPAQTSEQDQQINKDAIEDLISLEVEMPESLYQGMHAFIHSHNDWDQYKLVSSALANFLFQNGCEDRAVTEHYLDDLFCRSSS
tara:strand:+ start:853 stop:1152 length:300 start_codon:yes stop_codon:yes gene_type:complete